LWRSRSSSSVTPKVSPTNPCGGPLWHLK
jgi:hypothetical protein